MSFKKWFRRISSTIPQWVDDIAPEILQVTRNIRTLLQNVDAWLSSDIASLVVKVIPVSWGVAFRDIVLAALHRAIPVVLRLEECNGDLSCMLKKLLISLSFETEKGANCKLQALASTMLAEIDGKKRKENIYDKYMQLAYSETIV